MGSDGENVKSDTSVQIQGAQVKGLKKVLLKNLVKKSL